MATDENLRESRGWVTENPNVLPKTLCFEWAWVRFSGTKTYFSIQKCTSERIGKIFVLTKVMNKVIHVNMGA